MNSCLNSLDVVGNSPGCFKPSITNNPFNEILIDEVVDYFHAMSSRAPALALVPIDNFLANDPFEGQIAVYAEYATVGIHLPLSTFILSLLAYAQLIFPELSLLA